MPSFAVKSVPCALEYQSLVLCLRCQKTCQILTWWNVKSQTSSSYPLRPSFYRLKANFVSKPRPDGWTLYKESNQDCLIANTNLSWPKQLDILSLAQSHAVFHTRHNTRWSKGQLLSATDQRKTIAVIPAMKCNLKWNWCTAAADETYYPHEVLSGLLITSARRNVDKAQTFLPAFYIS